MGERTSKQERREARRRAAARARLQGRLRWGGIIAAVLLALALWQVDRVGAQETVQAEVIETRVYRHFTSGGRSHTHQAATLEIEGVTQATLERADDLQRGQTVPVRIRRGLFSGAVYFLNRDDGVVVSEPPDDTPDGDINPAASPVDDPEDEG